MSAPQGVMTADYVRQRRERLHVAFRLASRAQITADAFRELSGKYREGISILDLGAADGATLDSVHRELAARESLGIEYAPELLREARRLSAGVTLVRGDVTEAHPAVEPESRELVMALAVLEHVEAPERVFEQAYRALAPGGLFVATCPSSLWDKISGFFRLHAEEHHEQAFDRPAFERLARGAGLVPVTYRRFMCAPIAFLPYLRIPVSPIFALRIDAMLRSLRIFELFFVNQLFVARKPGG